MALTMYAASIPAFLNTLGAMSKILDKAAAHCAAKKIDPATLLTMRLYPDMFTLERQFRQVCNHALGAGRVAGVDLPSLPDQDNSFAEIQTRLDKTIDFLKGLKANQIDGKDDSPVTVTIGGQPQTLKAQNYLYHFAMLQVQFHATTAYDLIRHVGVAVGKRDYLGPRPTN